MDASSQDDWCYLDLNGQHQGPFPISYLQGALSRSTVAPACSSLTFGLSITGLNQSGYFNQEALFWQEGQSEWKQLKDLPQLAQVLGQAPGPAVAGVAAIGATVEAAEAGMEDIGVFEGRDGEGQILQQRSTKAGRSVHKFSTALLARGRQGQGASLQARGASPKKRGLWDPPLQQSTWPSSPCLQVLSKMPPLQQPKWRPQLALVGGVEALRWPVHQ